MTSNNWSPIRAWLAGAVNQAALAAGAEASVTLPWQSTGAQPLPRNFSAIQGGGVVGMLILATVLPVAAEANVMYVAEVTAITVNNVTLKVKNVGSVGGAQLWAVNALLLDQGDVAI